jgi:uncharacterized membrane protein
MPEEVRVSTDAEVGLSSEPKGSGPGAASAQESETRGSSAEPSASSRDDGKVAHEAPRQRARESKSEQFWQKFQRAFSELVRLGPPYLAIVLSPALALWTALNADFVDYIAKNNLAPAQRHEIILFIGGSFAVLTALYLVAFRLLKRRDRALTFVGGVERLNDYALILTTLPLIAGLCIPRLETSAPIFTAFLTLTITGLCMLWLYRLLGPRAFNLSAEPFAVLKHPLAPRVLMGLVALTYMLVMSYFTIIDHHNLSTETYDLAIYDNVVWQTWHGKFLGSSLTKGGVHASAHFDPILVLVALVYPLAPRAETLLVFQTVWLASGSFAVWASARMRLKNEWFASVLAAAYLLYPALHGVNTFDFHSLALLTPLLPWAVYLLDAGRMRAYWLILPLMLTVREDVSLLACFVGTYAILSGRPRTGIATILVSLTYLALVKAFAMPDSNLLMATTDKTYGYAYYYKDMIPHQDEGVRGFVVSLLTNPLFALSVLFKQERVLYFLHLFIPLLLLPFASGKKVVLFVYGLIFIGLASRWHVYSLHFQYSAILFPALFAALPDGFARVVDSAKTAALGIERRRFAWALLAGVFVATLLTSMQYGATVPNSSFKAGWSPLVRFPSEQMKQRYQKVRELIAKIPPNAPVCGTENLVPHVSNREFAHRFPAYQTSDYLLVQPERMSRAERRQFDQLLRSKEFLLVDKGFGVELYRRNPEHPESKKKPSERKAGFLK